MSQISGLPGWAQRLHRALRGSERSVEDLYGCLDLSYGGGWLADALHGRSEPTVSEYALLAGCAGVPLSVLTGMVPIERSLSVALRAGVLDTSEDVSVVIQRAQAILEDFRLLVSWFPQAKVERDRTLAKARRGCSGDGYAKRAGQMTAEHVRDLLDLADDPIMDLVELVESCGVPVFHEALPQSVHGITVRDDVGGTSQALILVNTLDSPGRQRFTLAHEFDHVLHNDGDALIVDRAESPDVQDQTERRADNFARHFLAPDGGVRKFWRKVESEYRNDSAALAHLMIHFGMSREASVCILEDVLRLPKDRFSASLEDPVHRFMGRFGLGEEWLAANENSREPAASPWLLSMALDGYAAGVVRADVAATVLGRDDVATLEAELVRQGWTA